MSHIFYIPGLVYSDETDEQSQEREREYEAHNRAQDALDAINSLPMESYRDWSQKHGVKSSRTL